MEFRRLSIPQLERHIRGVARDQGRIVLTSHAERQMLARRVPVEEVWLVLQGGLIAITPEEDVKTARLVCRMARRLDGREVMVCVALDDADPDLIVVTVIA